MPLERMSNRKWKAITLLEVDQLSNKSCKNTNSQDAVVAAKKLGAVKNDLCLCSGGVTAVSHSEPKETGISPLKKIYIKIKIYIVHDGIINNTKKYSLFLQYMKCIRSRSLSTKQYFNLKKREKKNKKFSKRKIF